MQLEDIARFGVMQHSSFIISRAENWKLNCKLNSPTEAVVIQWVWCCFLTLLVLYTIYIHNVHKGSVEVKL